MSRVPNNQEGDSIDYDFENDSIFFYKKGASYKHSLDLDDIIIDFDDNDVIKGVEILNASKKLNIPKRFLNNPISLNLKLKISAEKIELNINVKVKMRNSSVPKTISTYGTNNFGLPSGTMAMTC